MKYYLLVIAGLIQLKVCAQDNAVFSLEESRDIITNYTFNDMMSGGEKSRYVYLNMTEVSVSSLIDRSGSIHDLPLNLRGEISIFVTNTSKGELTLNEYIEKSPVDALVVVHHGKIVFESYPGMHDFQKHNIMSSGKTFVSALIGILESESKIDVSLPMTFYIPELKNSDWDRVKVIDMLDMSTGMCDNPSDSKALCINDFWNTYNDKKKDLLDFCAQIKAHRPAGEAFEYSNVSTVLLSIIIENITHKKFADYFGEKIWRPMGAEGDAIIHLGPNLKPAVVGFESTTARDLARFGMLYTPSGKEGVIPSEHIDNIQNGGRSEIFKATPRMELEILDIDVEENLVDGEFPSHNTYQWDIVMDDGDFFKGGFRGQGLYVSPNRDLVIVFFSHQINEMGRISRQLAKSGMFDN